MNATDLAPKNEKEAAEQVSEAFSAGTRLGVVGGGTRADIGHPIQTQKKLTSARLSGITNYEPAELVMTVKPGTPMKKIDAALKKARQRLVFEPMDHRALLGSEGEPTIGGVIAGNVSGPRRILAGAARDSLLGVRFVNGRGEVIKNGGRVMKNVTGLDLVKLMAGSWGTLGFLTEVTLKVLPAPETEKTLAIRGLTEEEAATTMAVAMGTSAEMSGAAHLPQLVANRVIGGELSDDPATLLRVEGFADSVKHRIELLSDLFAKSGELQILNEKKSVKLWREVRDCIPFADGTRKPVWRISMAPMEGCRMVAALRLEAAADAFYDWQGGLVWLRIEDDPAPETVRKLVAANGGGHATLIRADGAFRASIPVFEPQPKPVALLSKRIKEQFDPKGILNPGRMAFGL
jgi:glycolate oxidase FAD binding subunit